MGEIIGVGENIDEGESIGVGEINWIDARKDREHISHKMAFNLRLPGRKIWVFMK